MKIVRKFEDARDRFSQVLKKASRRGPRTISRQRESTAAEEADLVNFFRRSPLRGANLDLEREPRFGRASAGDQPG